MTENTNTQQTHHLNRLTKVAKGTRFYELEFASGERARLFIVADGIFRLIVDSSGLFEPLNPELTIPLSNFSLDTFEQSRLLVTDETFTVKSGQYSIRLQRHPAIFSIFDDNLHRYRMMQKAPLELGASHSSEILVQNKNEFYYGGGQQNGRFSHKGQEIEIKNTNLTGQGAVACPISFFWSNAGFGELRNTWQNGNYDFGSKDPSQTIISHESPIFDNFYLIGDSPSAIISQYYKLTGQPLFLPKYTLGLGYMANFVNTSWKEADPQHSRAIKFEDGNSYEITHDPENVYAKSSFNGEEKYQFSARAMIERFHKNHFPLSWMVPNFNSDAQLAPTSVENLASFADEQNIKLGFYGQLPENAPANFLVNKTLPANSGNAKIIKNIAADSDPLVSKNKALRPWTTAANGWSAIQTLSATATSNVGGEWDEIGTQIASFLGLSLSGQANFGSSVDGLESGGNAQFSVRDFEWKTFTPLLYSIDGFGAGQKTPFAFNSKISRINRAYLELRHQLTPYLYSLAQRAQKGEPIIRPLFLAFPHEKVNYTEQVHHEFMLGDSLLVAPITNGREDQKGNSVKDNLYLPDHRTIWIDLFTGQKLIGGRVYDRLQYPLWHLPVYVRSGSIIEKGLRKADIFPQGKTSAVLYSDDGKSNEYESGKSATTKITSSLDDGKLSVTVHPTNGNYHGLENEQKTVLNIMSDQYPGRLTLKINDQVASLPEFGSRNEFEQADAGFFFNQDFMPAQQFGKFTGQLQPALQIKLPKAEIHSNKYEIIVENYHYCDQIAKHSITDSAISSPRSASILTDRLTSRSITVNWTNPVALANHNIKADIEVNGLIHTNIDGYGFTFHDLTPNTRYRFRIRNKVGNKVSDWSEYFGTKTKPDQMDYAINNIHVTSTLKSDAQMPVQNLVDHTLASEWLTKEEFSKDKELVLTFTFDQAYKLSRMVYVPRSRDRKGHILRAQIAISKDGENFSEYSDNYNWPNDSKNKVIGLRDVVAKTIKLKILASSDNLASAKEILFFVAKD